MGNPTKGLQRYDYKDIGDLTLFRMDGEQKGQLSAFPKTLAPNTF